MIIYKIKNKDNDKVYIGYSQNDNPNNLGSGKYIKEAVKKFGPDSFEREVLATYDDSTPLFKILEFYESFIRKYKADNPKCGYNESIQENVIKPKRLTNKIQVLVSPETEHKLNSIIIEKAMKKRVKPIPVSKYVRNLILEHITEELTPEKLIK